MRKITRGRGNLEITIEIWSSIVDAALLEIISLKRVVWTRTKTDFLILLAFSHFSRFKEKKTQAAEQKVCKTCNENNSEGRINFPLLQTFPLSSSLFSFRKIVSFRKMISFRSSVRNNDYYSKKAVIVSKKFVSSRTHVYRIGLSLSSMISELRPIYIYIYISPLYLVSHLPLHLSPNLLCSIYINPTR